MAAASASTIVVPSSTIGTSSAAPRPAAPRPAAPSTIGRRVLVPTDVLALPDALDGGDDAGTVDEVAGRVAGVPDATGGAVAITSPGCRVTIDEM